MEINLNPLLPAFYTLWNSAMLEPHRASDQDSHNANTRKIKLQNNLQANPLMKGTSELLNHQHDLQMKPHTDLSKKSTLSDDTVVVCTLDCDQGSTFVKQIISRGVHTSVWSRAEDLFVDWLNSELTSQHAEQVNVTIYFCNIPLSTTSDGIRLWMKNLRTEGKEINIKIKVANLAPIVLETNAENAGLTQGRHRRTSNQEKEAEDTIRALKNLTSKGVQIEAISIGDWMQLITLLTDRTSLQALDLKRSPCTNLLTSILQTGNSS